MCSRSAGWSRRSVWLAVVMVVTVVTAVGAALPATVRVAPAPAAVAAGCPPPTRAEAEAIARRYFDIFTRGDADALDALLSADYRHQGAVVAFQDRAIHRERLLDAHRGFPDGVYTIEWMMVEGDIVAVRHVFNGTHLGEFTGVPASGRPVSVGAFHVHRIACGQIAETWNAGDALGLFRQIGVLVGPPTTPADQEVRAPQRAMRTPCPATTPAQNAATARRWYDDVLNQGRFDVLDGLLDENVVHHAAVFTDLVGPEQVAGSLRALLTGFPDIRYTVDGIVTDGDRVLVRWTGRGTQTGPFLGVPPSGRTVEWSGINAFRFDCGVIVEGWSEANGLQVLRQIGGAP
jgi:steroid delta-isomerase-like uncharacterized protein